jgi:hypothetical protein
MTWVDCLDYMFVPLLVRVKDQNGVCSVVQDALTYYILLLVMT